MDTIHLRKQNTCHSLKKITYPCRFFFISISDTYDLKLNKIMQNCLQ